MPTSKQNESEEKIGLMLSAVERKIILVEVMCLDEAYEEAIRTTPTEEPIMLTLDQWDDLGGYIAAEANHTRDKKSQRKLDAIFTKIEKLLSSHTDEEPINELKIFRPQEE
jgi:ribosomal protein S15P/S13E